MTMLDAAIDLVSKGFHVFPLAENTKDKPLLKGYQKKALSTKEEVSHYWDKYPSANIAISTTHFGTGGGLLVVDVDNKNGISGDDSVFDLELDGYSFPKTFTQKTPSGGKHLVYFVEEPVKQGTKVLGPGLDIRSRGGYIVASGSTLDGTPYTTQDDAPIAPAPQWIVDKCGETKPKSDSPAPATPVNTEVARTRAVEYLSTAAAHGETGTRNHAAYVAACNVKDFGVLREECFSLLREYWPCNPPLENEELSQVVNSAYKYGENPIGVNSPEAQFTPVVPAAEENTASYLERLNKEFALVFEDGGHTILQETRDEKGHFKRKFLPEITFKRKMSPNTVTVGDGRTVNRGSLWLDWAGRREYQGICFAPEREARNGYYNLWSGFTVEPLPYDAGNSDQKAGFDAFIEHAKFNVCGGDESLFTWLMGYFAHMIQKPYERPLTTLVFKGRKGTGKNALIDRVGNLLGNSHYLVAHDGRYLTSNFNGHMDSCLCLVLDEAFWSGDKSAEGKLKGITTAPTIMIERKGKEPYTVDNLVRLVVIGNEDWLVPASADERRYAVFQMGEKRMQDVAFFSAMAKNLDRHGGNRILLHFLKTFDLSRVDPNVAPQTEALLEQKMASLGAFEQWWHECLVSGKVVGQTWEQDVDKAAVWHVCKDFFKDMQFKGWIDRSTKMGKKLRTLCPSVQTDKQRRDGNEFIKVYRFPDLETARREWSERIGHAIDWSKE